MGLLGCGRSHVPTDPCGRLALGDPIELPGLAAYGSRFVRSGDHLFFSWVGSDEGAWGSWLTILDRAGSVVTTREIPEARAMVPVPAGVVLVWIECDDCDPSREDPGPDVFWTLAVDELGGDLSAPQRLGALPIDGDLWALRATVAGADLVLLATLSFNHTFMYVLDELGRPPGVARELDRTGRPAAPHLELTAGGSAVDVVALAWDGTRRFAVYRPRPDGPFVEERWVGELELDGRIRPVEELPDGGSVYFDFASGPAGLALSSWAGGWLRLLGEDGRVANAVSTYGAEIGWLGGTHIVQLAVGAGGGPPWALRLFDPELVLIDEVPLGSEFLRDLATLDEEAVLLEDRVGYEPTAVRVRFVRCSPE